MCEGHEKICVARVERARGWWKCEVRREGWEQKVGSTGTLGNQGKEGSFHSGDHGRF